MKIELFHKPFYLSFIKTTLNGEQKYKLDSNSR